MTTRNWTDANREYFRNYARLRAARLKEAKLCLTCGITPVTDFFRCLRCRRRSSYVRTWRKKNEGSHT